MRVLQGYIDVAGQASRYSTALTRRNVYSRSWLYERNLKNENYDRIIDISKEGIWGGRLKKLKICSEVLMNFNILHIHKGYSLFHNALDLKIAGKLNIKVFVHYRGSEIRKDVQSKKLQQEVIDKIKREADYSNMILVKDGQLGELIKPYVSNFIIFPNIVNVESIHHICKKYNTRKKLKVVHIPSNSLLKGSAIIRSVLDKLKHIIDYKEYTNMAHIDVLSEFIDADIVIDQILTGTYGNTALESMALGTPVLNYLVDDFMKYEPEIPPIIHVTPGSLGEVILHLHENRDLLEEYGKASKEFVKKYHSYESVGEKLIQLYKTY